MTENAQLAKDVYSAELESPEHETGIAKAGRFVAGLASAAFGDDGSAFSGVSVVVRRLDDHSVLARIDGGNYESDDTLLNIVRGDLEQLSPEEFVRRWQEEDAPQE